MTNFVSRVNTYLTCRFKKIGLLYNTLFLLANIHASRLACLLAGLNMEHASVEATIIRLKKAAGATTDIELSKKLGLSKQSIAAARAKGEIPAIWIPKAAKLFHVSMDWLYWGADAPSSPALEDGERSKTLPMAESPPITREEKLELELEKEREERRTISAENRQLHRDKAELLKEVGELRATIARLEASKNRLAVANGVPSENSSVA